MTNLRRKIFRNYDTIVCMTSLHDLSDDFISRRIFEICDWEKITNITLSTTERNRTFLDILLRTDSHGYKLLLDLLDLQGHGNLVTKISATYVNEHVDKEIEAHLRKIQKDFPNKPTRERSALELQTLAFIDRHKADKTFVVTKAVEKGIEVLTEHGILIYFGLPGNGKTLNAFEVMAHFKRSHPDWMFLELDDVRDWKIYIDLSVDSLILLDDCLGSSNTDTNIINESEKYWPNIHACIKTGKVKVIMTVRKTIFVKNRPKLEKYKIFSKAYRVNLTSDKMKLTKAVKLEILKRHLDSNTISICKSKKDGNYMSADNKTPIKISERTVNKIIDTDPLIGFPQTCYMFCNDRKYTQLGVKYFKNPSQSLIDEVKTLIDLDSKLSEKLQYCIMCYMLLKGGIIDVDELDTDMFKKVIQSVGFSPEPRHRDISNSIERLTSIYIVKKGDIQLYEFKHQTILESVALCFYEDNAALLIELCSKEFIVEFIRRQKYHKTKGEIVLKLKEREYSFLIQRFMYSLQHDEGIERYRWWVKHPILDDQLFVERMMSVIESNILYKQIIESCVGGNHGIYALAGIYDKTYFINKICSLFKVKLKDEEKTDKRTNKYQPTSQTSWSFAKVTRNVVYEELHSNTSPPVKSVHSQPTRTNFPDTRSERPCKISSAPATIVYISQPVKSPLPFKVTDTPRINISAPAQTVHMSHPLRTYLYVPTQDLFLSERTYATYSAPHQFVNIPRHLLQDTVHFGTDKHHSGTGVHGKTAIGRFIVEKIPEKRYFTNTSF